MRKLLLIFLFCLVVNSVFPQDNVSTILNKYTSDNSISNDSLFTLISNWQNYDQPAETNKFILEYNEISDTLNAPYVIYIPQGYNCKQQTPVIFYLHGGVSTKGFHETPIEYAKQNYFTSYAKLNNWIAVYPLGNITTAWWTLTGIKNLEAQVRKLKSNYNIDDNRIYVTGFSDGGSGSFHLALNAPDDFASFYPLNGMISVGSAVTGIPVFLPNLKNRSVYAINTDEDGLYPAKQMRRLMALSLEAGADLFYKEYWGIGHSFDYADKEVPIILNDMKTKAREIFSPSIYWETCRLEYGKCDWLQITGIDTTMAAKNWQIQYNTKLADKRVSFGFYNDREYEDSGTRVTKIVPNSAAANMGLQTGDIILAMDNTKAENIGKLIELRETKKRGDSFSLTVLRNNEEILLSGQFPEVTKYNAFNYTEPSAVVKANYYGNHFDVKTSKVSELTIYIHPEMVNLEIPVVIDVNGNEEFNDIISINRDFMVKNFLTNYDRKALWVNKIVLKIN